MSRRGENIYKRKDGRWEGRYIKGRKPNGQIKYGYIYHRKYITVKQKLIRYKALYQEKDYTQPFEGNLKIWVEQWLHVDVKKRVKESTFASYHYKIYHYILPYIGNNPLQKLSNKEVQQWIDQLIEQCLSATTIHLVVQLLRMSLKEAMEKKVLRNDPTEGIFLPKKKKQKVRALSIQEQKKIEKEASKEASGASVLIALYTGLRIGEISALKWTDIDFSSNLIHVQRTIQRIPLENKLGRTQLIMQEAKTLDSMRSIPFSAHLKKYLLGLKSKSKSQFVIATKEKALEPRTIAYHFRKILIKLNLNHLHFHQLRHTFATRALEVGGDIASISALLGHQSSNFTLEVYMDSFLHQRKKIAKKVEQKYFQPNFLTR